MGICSEESLDQKASIRVQEEHGLVLHLMVEALLPFTPGTPLPPFELSLWAARGQVI